MLNRMKRKAPNMVPLICRLRLFLTLSTLIFVGANEPDAPVDDDNEGAVVGDLLDWLRAVDGTATSKVGFDTTTRGLVALDDISEGEIILKIPNDAEFRGFSSNEFNVCDTAWSFLLEYSQGPEESPYFPYAEFLMEYYELLPEEIPVTLKWSVEAQEWMTKNLVRTELEPVPFGRMGYSHIAGCDDPKYSFLDTQESWELFPSILDLVNIVGWSKILIPIYDIIERNHTLANVKIDENNRAFGLHDETIVKSIKDIPKGASLYAGSDSPATFFNLYGEIQPYPHRWFFQTGYEGKDYGSLTDGVGFIFEVHKDVDIDGRYNVIFPTGQANTYQLNWLNSHHRRLKALDLENSSIEDEHEREMIRAYQQLLLTDIEQAMLWAHGDPYSDESQTCNAPTSAEATDENVCSNSDSLSDRYDDLRFRPDTLDYNTGVHFSCSNPVSSSDIYDFRSSPVQSIEWARFVNPHSGENDTCLLLNEIIHSCTSIRPQVHEPIMHYPSSYLDTVKRVLFVGGGDLIILHEILKYPSLELVIGMELDQDVVRSSFRNYGVQPNFDNRKVKWWFGDASRSLTMLPEEYFGTFDLVFIDLLSIVFDSLRVGDELITDYMMKLLKPDGILVRQEDFVGHNIIDFAKHTLEYRITGLPYLCQQSFTMGSNGIDFSKKQPIERNIETVFFDESYTNNHTSIWLGLSKNKRRVRKSLKDTKDKENNKGSSEPKYGILLVIEAEDVDVSTRDLASVRVDISKTLKKSGLSERSVESFDGEEFSTLVYMLNEGYLLVRVWPKHKYCAFDLQLWNSINQHDEMASNLVLAVGGNLESSTSSFLITTSGMYGLETTNSDNAVSNDGENPLPEDDPVPLAPLSKEEFSGVLNDFVSSLLRVSEPIILVVCADKSVPCSSIKSLSKLNAEPVTIWDCTSSSQNPDRSSGALKKADMFDCEQQIRQIILEQVAVDRKISGIVFDPTASLEMGQIIHKIFSNAVTRKVALDEKFLLLAPVEGQAGTDWRNALLERFRAELILFNPVYHSTVVLHSTTGSVIFEALAAGDVNYHMYLINCLSSIHEKSGLDYHIQRSKSGLLNHRPDFQPDKVTLQEEYNLKDSYKQWKNQKPLGQQHVFQLEVQPSQKIEVGDAVMINVFVKTLSGVWSPGKVLNIYKTGLYSVEASSGQRYTVDRSRVRLMNDYTTLEPLEFGEHVFRKNERGKYSQALVSEVKEDGTYMAQEWSDGVAFAANRSDLVRMYEKPIMPNLPVMSCSDLENMLNNSLGVILKHYEVEKSTLSTSKEVTGSGCVLTSLWEGGCVIASWDGRIHVDINLFTVDSVPSILIKQIKSDISNKISDLKFVQQDSFPRGVGRVVNFQEDINSVWFGEFHDEP